MEWLQKCNRLCTCDDFHPNMVRFHLFQQKIYNNYYKFLLSSFVFICMEVKVRYFFLKCYVELEVFILIFKIDFFIIYFWKLIIYFCICFDIMFKIENIFSNIAFLKKWSWRHITLDIRFFIDISNKSLMKSRCRISFY